MVYYCKLVLLYNDPVEPETIILNWSIMKALIFMIQKLIVYVNCQYWQRR